MWRNIDEKLKLKYDAKFKKEHEKYTKEKEAYEEKFGKIHRKSKKAKKEQSTEKKPVSKPKGK